MTIKIEEEKELLTVKPRESSPSQRRNEDVDPIKRESEEDEILYSTDGQLIFAPSVYDHGVCLMLNSTVLDPRILVQAIEQAEDAYWLDDEPDTPVHSVDVHKETSNVTEEYCEDCCEQSCTSSSSSEISQVSSSKSVRFTKNLISDIRYRPRTLPEDLRTLFYTYEETQRFRQEYRLERRIIERMDEGADGFLPEGASSGRTNELYDSPLEDDEDQDYAQQDKNQLMRVAADNVIVGSEDEQINDDISSSSCSNHNKCKYDISRVVVMHNDTLKTYDDSVLHVLNSETVTNGNKKFKTSNEDFFDNDSFWSGSITWY